MHTTEESLVEWGYRDADNALRGERARLADLRRRELATLSPALLAVYTRRRARIAGGKVAVLAAAALPLGGILCAFGLGLPLTAWLAGGVLAAFIAYAWSARRARARLARALEVELRASDDAFADVERLAAPATRLVARLARAEASASIFWPLAGAALLVPLLLHLGVYVLVSLPAHYSVVAADFDKWILASLVLVIPAHIALVVCVRMFARELGAGRRAMSGWAAFGWCCLGGVVPGAILYLIPTTLVALTALVFVPALFGAARRRFLAEEQLLAR